MKPCILDIGAYSFVQRTTHECERLPIDDVGEQHKYLPKDRHIPQKTSLSSFYIELWQSCSMLSMRCPPCFSDIVNVTSGMSDKVCLFIQSFTVFIASCVMTLMTNWRLALVAFCLVPFIAASIFNIVIVSEGQYHTPNSVAACVRACLCVRVRVCVCVRARACEFVRTYKCLYMRMCSHNRKRTRAHFVLCMARVCHVTWC